MRSKKHIINDTEQSDTLTVAELFTVSRRLSSRLILEEDPSRHLLWWITSRECSVQHSSGPGTLTDISRL